MQRQTKFNILYVVFAIFAVFGLQEAWQRAQTVEYLSAADLAASRVQDAYTRKLMLASAAGVDLALKQDSRGLN